MVGGPRVCGAGNPRDDAVCGEPVLASVPPTRAGCPRGHVPEPRSRRAGLEWCLSPPSVVLGRTTFRPRAPVLPPQQPPHFSAPKGDDASSASPAPPGQLSGTQGDRPGGAPTPSNRVSRTRQALIHGLRTHLLPPLERDLDAVVRQTGVTRESLRKLRTALRAKGGTDRLPTADALIAIATGYGWSIERLLDPTCGDPAVPLASPEHTQDAAGVLAARAALVLRHAAATANDPDVRAIPRQADLLIHLFDRVVRHVYQAARAECARAQAAALQNWCSAAVARLERDDAVWCATQDAPALGRTAAVYAARLRRALGERRRDQDTGEVTTGEVTIHASDPWERVRDVGPAVSRLLAHDLELSACLPYCYEITAAEVRSARASLRQHTFVSDGHTYCPPEAVLRAYQRLLDQRRYPADLVQPLRPIFAAAMSSDSDVHHSMVALNELFAWYCKAIGAAWDATAGQFLVLGTGHGAFDGVLMPDWDESRLVILPTPSAAGTGGQDATGA